MSPYSIKRSWINIEIGIAYGCNKLIVPILDKITQRALPPIIDHRETIDINNFEKYLKQLIKRAKQQILH